MKRSLHSLRTWLKNFRKQALEKGIAKVLQGRYEFTWMPAGEPDEEPTEITESELFADPGENKGHPKAGTYTVRILDADTGDVLEEQSGDWKGDFTPTFETERGSGDGNTGALRAINASTSILLSNMHADMARVRAESARAFEDARLARERELTQAEAFHSLKQKMHDMEIVNAEYEYQKRQAEAREAAAREELEALREQGGEFAPAAEAAVRTLFDRGMEQFGLTPAAGDREAGEQACEIIAAELISPHALPYTLEMAVKGILTWEPLRAAIIAAYDVDPGPEPSLHWRPPVTPAPEAESPEENLQ